MKKNLSTLSFSVKHGEEEMTEFSFNEKLYNVMQPFMKALSEEMNGLKAGDGMAFFMNVAEIVAKNSILTLHNASEVDIDMITFEFCKAVKERISDRKTANRHDYIVGLQ